MACINMKEKDCTSVFAKVVVEDKLPKFRLRLEGRRLEKWSKILPSNFAITYDCSVSERTMMNCYTMLCISLNFS